MRKQISFWRGAGIRLFLLACVLTMSANAWADEVFLIGVSNQKWYNGTNGITVQGALVPKTTIIQNLHVYLYVDGKEESNKWGEVSGLPASTTPTQQNQQLTWSFTKSDAMGETTTKSHRFYLYATWENYSGTPSTQWFLDLDKSKEMFGIDNTKPTFVDFTITPDYAKDATHHYFKKSNTPKSITANFSDTPSGLNKYWLTSTNAWGTSAEGTIDLSSSGMKTFKANVVDSAQNYYGTDDYGADYAKYTYYVDGSAPTVSDVTYENAITQRNTETGAIIQLWYKKGVEAYLKAPISDPTISGNPGSGLKTATFNDSTYNVAKGRFGLNTSSEFKAIDLNTTKIYTEDSVGNSQSTALTYSYGVDGTAPYYESFSSVYKSNGEAAYSEENSNFHKFWLKQGTTGSYMPLDILDKDAGKTWDGSGVDSTKTTLFSERGSQAKLTLSSKYDKTNKRFVIDCSTPWCSDPALFKFTDYVGNENSGNLKDGAQKNVVVGIDGAAPTLESWSFESETKPATLDELNPDPSTNVAEINSVGSTYPYYQANKNIYWYNHQDETATFLAFIRDYYKSESSNFGSGLNNAVEKTFFSVPGTEDDHLQLTNKTGEYWDTSLTGYRNLNGTYDCSLTLADNVDNSATTEHLKFGYDGVAPELRTNYGHKVFTATDEHSGVYLIQYSRDGGTTWNDYADVDSAFFMNLSVKITDAAAYFQMRAIDHVGNTSKPVQFFVKEQNIIEITDDGNMLVWAPINDEGVPALYMAPSETDPLAIKKIDRSIYNGKRVSSLIKSVEVPEEVYWIGDSAFYGCSNIEEVLLFNEKQVPVAFAHTFEGLDTSNAILYGEFDFIEPDDPAIVDTYLNYQDGSVYVYNQTSENKPYNANNQFYEVLPLTPPANQIWYMTDDRKPLDLDNTAEFLRDNFNRVDTAQTYLRSMGKIFFDGPLNRIGVAAFKGNQRITKVYLPDTALLIAQDAFRDCPNLRRVTTPNYDRAYEGLKTAEIGPNAFENCPKLTKVRFGRGIESIDAFAFAYCSTLQSIKLPVSLKNIYGNAFSYNPNLVVATLNAPEMAGLWVESFEKCNKNLVIYVPYKSLLTYEGISAAKGLNFQTKIPVLNNGSNKASVYCHHNMTIPAGITFQTMKQNGSTQDVAGSTAPGGAGYIVNFLPGVESTEIVTTAEQANSINENVLRGVLTDTQVSYITNEDLYIAATGSKAMSTDVVPAFSAFYVKKDGAILKFNYDEATGISTINADADVDANSFNTAGQKINNSYKGVVIKNGQKYLNK